jgi:glycine hydroxymethyltransferase
MKDTQIEALIKAEKTRQGKVINLIASENIVSADVLKALGSELTNKYAEGYAHARYYGGNEIIDKVEDLCIERALKTFKLSKNKWHVNVQPLSGSPANLAVYSALISPGDKIMAMDLSHGGHLTHGFKVSFTGRLYTQIAYGVDEKTFMLDYDAILKIAEKFKPKIIITGYSAYPRKINFKKFREIADSVGALLMVDMAHISGLIAGGAHPSPFPYADIVTSTTHKTLRGPRSGIIFAKKDERELGKKIDKAVFPGLQGGPHMNQIAAVAVALQEAQTPAFKKYIEQVCKNAQALAGELKKRGWRILSGGTDNHLVLVDVWMDGKGIGGKDASDLLEKEGIIVNKNTIPGETRTPVNPSGIRLGSAAETTRGLKEKDFVKIAKRIDEILRK